MRDYQPKKSSKRWLENAPDYVLAIYDAVKFNDRYTVLLGGKFWNKDMGRNIMILGISEAGSFYYETMPSINRDACGKKIAWKDLPERVQNAVLIACADDEPTEETNMSR